jgi:hypothetical protein
MELAGSIGGIPTTCFLTSVKKKRLSSFISSFKEAVWGMELAASGTDMPLIPVSTSFDRQGRVKPAFSPLETDR